MTNHQPPTHHRMNLLKSHFQISRQVYQISNSASFQKNQLQSMTCWWPSCIKCVVKDHSASRFKFHSGQTLVWVSLPVCLPEVGGFLRAVWFPPPSINWPPQYQWGKELHYSTPPLLHTLADNFQFSILIFHFHIKCCTFPEHLLQLTVLVAQWSKVCL